MLSRRIIAWLTVVAVAAVILGILWRADASAVSAAPSAVTISGPAAAHQGQPGAWTCEARPWLVGDRFGDFSADNDTLAQPLPGDYLATIAAHTSARYYHLVLYSPVYGDLIVDYPFSAIAAEPGTVFPTGRYDPIGKPSLSFNGGMLKFIGGLWGGGGGGDRGGRVYTFCRLT